MNKYEVNWTEYHSVEIEARNEEDAQEKAFNLPRSKDTCMDIPGGSIYITKI